MTILRIAFSFFLLFLCMTAPLNTEERKKLKLETIGTISEYQGGGVLYLSPNEKNLPKKIYFLKQDVMKYEKMAGKKVKVKGTASISDNYSLFVWVSKINEIE